MLLFCITSLKLYFEKLLPHLLEANELSNFVLLINFSGTEWRRNMLALGINTMPADALAPKVAS